jgi:hypothetical protein
MLLNLGVEIPEDEVKNLVEKLEPFTLSFTPPGILLYKLVDQIAEGKPLYICETGCTRDQNPTALMSDGWSSVYFSKWVYEHDGSRLMSIDLNRTNLGFCWMILDRFGYNDTAKVNLTNGESVLTITNLAEHPDVFYLDSCDGLEHGLAEFKAAMVHQPKLIIMDDFISKAASAAEYANQQNIPFIQMGRYTVFKTSHSAERLIT